MNSPQHTTHLKKTIFQLHEKAYSARLEKEVRGVGSLKGCSHPPSFACMHIAQLMLVHILEYSPVPIQILNLLINRRRVDGLGKQCQLIHELFGSSRFLVHLILAPTTTFLRFLILSILASIISPSGQWQSERIRKGCTSLLIHRSSTM